VCRVRQVGTEEWKDAFVLQTISKPEIKDANGANLTGYKNNLLNWTASWIAFGFSGASVEVEISKIDGTATIIVGNASPGERSQSWACVSHTVSSSKRTSTTIFLTLVFE
jgi:hypothetical protein